jgi:hypothetical protein
VKRLYLEHVRPLTFEQLQERRKKVDYEKTKFYVNRFPSDVYIRDRSGLLTKVKPRIESTAFEADLLFICEQIQCSPQLTSDYVQQARQTPNSMRQYAHKVVLSQWANEPPVAARYSVEAQCSLSLKELLANDGIVYLEEHDIVVMYGLTEKEMEKIYHPYSIVGYAANSFEQIKGSNPYLRKGDFTFNIRIVDNHDQFGSRWILIDDTPFCIVAGKSDELTDGIYVTFSKNMLNGKGPQKLITDRFEFADGGNLPHYKLYESQQEALLARRSVQVEEAQARIRELEAKSTAAENSLRKSQQERDNAEREAQYRQARHEQDMEKLRRENEKLQKDHELYLQKQVAEMLAASRKNTAELIKCVPVVLSTIACTIALFKKK